MTGAQVLWGFFAPILAVLPRIGAAVAVVPLFPTSLFPMLLRGAICVSLSLCLYPHMAAHMPADMTALRWLALIAKEVFIGALLGFAVGAFIWAFESVGTVIDYQVGLSNAEIFDPFGGHDAGLLGRFMTRLGVVLFLVGGGLQTFASLLYESFHLWPVASFYPSLTERLAEFGSGSGRTLMELTVRLAAPAVLLLALVDLGFGLVGRVVPQLNVFFFTMPLKGALAALMMAVYLSYLADVVVGQMSALPGWLERLQPALSGY